MVDWGLVIGITATGLIVVFIALILLIFIIWLMGKINTAAQSKKKVKAKQEENHSLLSSKKDAASVKSDTAQNSIDSQTVAVIAAALSAEWGEKRPFIIKSLTREPADRPIWRQAGIADNTRPF